MKQKVVIKVSMCCAKSRTKAMKIAVSASGVVSAEIKGDDQIVVTGEGIDSAHLTVLIRKKVGPAQLVSITPDKKDDDKDKDKGKIVYTPWYQSHTPHIYYHEVCNQNQDSCGIM